MKPYVHLYHSAQLVLEWVMFRTKVVTNKTAHILGSIVYLFIYLFIHSFIQTFIYLFIYLFI